jgi:hypothetical protein
MPQRRNIPNHTEPVFRKAEYRLFNLMGSSLCMLEKIRKVVINLYVKLNKLNVFGRMLIWTFFLVLVCETRAQNLTAPVSYTLKTRDFHNGEDPYCAILEYVWRNIPPPSS